MLNQADIDRAKQELRLRRAETLKRHAEELQKLDAEQSEIDTLERLGQAFARKLSGAHSTASAGDPGEPDATAAEIVPSMSPTSPDFSPPRRKYQATNFELFARAFSTGTF